MFKVEFPYEIPKYGDCFVVAECRAIVGDEVSGLTLKFLDKDYNILQIEYDKDLFDELEEVATGCLVDNYYNVDAYSYMH